MPNECNYGMRIRGKKSDITILYNWLRASYSYHRGMDENGNHIYSSELLKEPLVYVVDGVFNKEIEHHLGFRIFDAELYDIYKEYYNDSIKPWMVITVEIIGYCAWSVCSCMMEDPMYGGYIPTFEHKELSRAIGIEKACKILNLECEIISEEPGMAFSEHYYINPDGIELDHTSDYSEQYNYDVDTYEEYCEKYKNDYGDDNRFRLEKEEFDDSLYYGMPYYITCENIDCYGDYIYTEICEPKPGLIKMDK